MTAAAGLPGGRVTRPARTAVTNSLIQCSVRSRPRRPRRCRSAAGPVRSIIAAKSAVRRPTSPSASGTPVQAHAARDEGSVQVLDGAAHRHRKQMFLDRMAPDSLARLTALAAQQWRGAAARWEGADRVVLLGEVRKRVRTGLGSAPQRVNRPGE